jgi:hypothetical protein
MTTALTRTCPGYLCNYVMELDALNLCAALCKYGYPAEVRENRSDWPGNLCGGPHTSFTYSVWMKDHNQCAAAREFRRGLYAAVGVLASPEAFAEGVLAGAALRGREKYKPKISGGRVRLPLQLAAKV